MPSYELPGVTSTKRGSMLIGSLVLLIALTVAATGFLIHETRRDTRMPVILRTENIGDGIGVGTPVRYDGVDVGSVARVDADGINTKKVTLLLDRAHLIGLTDNLFVDYSPSNLFGISEVALKEADGGVPLRDGIVVDLTGPRSNRQRDATMGVLIRTVAEATGDLFTPQLTEVLMRLSETSRQFTPLMETIVSMSRMVAETQKMPPSYLLDQYGSMLVGAGSLFDGTVGLVNRLTRIEILNNQRGLFDAAVSTVGEKFFPALANTIFTARNYLSDYTVMLVPILSAASSMVPTPEASSAQLSEILARLGNSFTQTPDGPVLNLKVIVDSFPGLATPLLASLPKSDAGADR